MVSVDVVSLGSGPRHASIHGTRNDVISGDKHNIRVGRVYRYDVRPNTDCAVVWGVGQLYPILTAINALVHTDETLRIACRCIQRGASRRRNRELELMDHTTAARWNGACPDG